jgi:CubicO group peptidase (beta-lactamase class C family)
MMMADTTTSRRAGLFGASALLLAQSLPAAAQVAPRSTVPRPQPLNRGFAQDRLARIAGVMQAEAERGSFPGAVTFIARHGETVHFEAHGHQDAAKTRRMTRDAIFMQASMTKPIVSTAAMMLVEEGRMKLDDPIAIHLPELRDLKLERTRDGSVELVAPARQPTVHDLLRHTAGFVYGDAAPTATIRDAYRTNNIQAGEAPITGDEMLRRLGTIPLAFEPGTRFFYSIAVDVLGLVVQRVTRQRLDRVLEERLFGPLGMGDTAWFVSPDKRARLAETLDSDPLKAEMWRAYRILNDERETSYLKGGAGLVSTAADYAKFAQMIASNGTFGGRRYLAAPVVNFMLSDHMVGFEGTPASSTGPGYGFGLGFAVRRQDGMGTAPGSVGDAMWAGAWGTSFTIDRAEGLVAIIMAQGPSHRGRTRMIFKDLVYAAMVESVRR